MTTDAVAALRRHQLTIAVLAAAAFFASAPGQSFLISVFVDDILEGTGLSRTAFSGLYAAGTVVSAVSMLVLGRLVDRYGLRVAWVVVSLALATACGLASLATGAVVVFLALALLRTSGQGSFTLVGTLLVATSFERRRGQAMAVANLGITAASVLLPPSVAALILAVGWRHAYQVLALAVAVLVLPLAVLVRPGPERAPAAPASGQGSPSMPAASRPATRLGISLPSATAARLLLILAAPPLVGTALTFHAVSILGEQQGLSYLQAGACLSVLGLSSAVGTVLSGLVADRISTRALLVLLSLVTLCAPLVLLAQATVAAYGAFAVLGIAMGATGVANGTVWARTFGLDGLARIQGTAQSSMITAAALAPLVPALGHTAGTGYVPALLLLGALAVVATLLATGVGREETRAG